MRAMLAALALAAVTAPAAASAPRLQTLYARPHGAITAFAQDGPLIAWFAPSTSAACNAVHVFTPANGLHFVLPQEGAARNVTCRWAVSSGSEVRLAIAWRASSVSWTLRENSPLPFDYVLGAGLTDKKERRFQEIAHARLGEGLWIGGMAGDSSTLVYGVTSVVYVDEVACLAGTGPCSKKVGGGGVYRLVGRRQPALVPGTTGAVAVATSEGAIAYVRAATVSRDGRPLAAPGREIDVVDSTSGRLLSAVSPQGAPVAIALAPTVLVTLERSRGRAHVVVYPRAGGQSWSVSVPATAAPELSANDQLAVFRVGHTIRGVDLQSHRLRTLAVAAAEPVGLSIDGSRLAWAENLHGRGRIRAVYLSGRG